VADLDPSEALTGRGQRDNYATPANLLRRQALFAFRDPEQSSGGSPLARIEWTGTERVLDAGCGDGLWTRALQDTHGVASVVGLDLSSGMLAGTRRSLGESAGLVAGDVRRLPFRDACFDAVLCFWMLYHVDDPVVALGEFHRVLRPGGHLIVTTNSTAPRALDELIGEALEEVTGQRRDHWLPPFGFAAENGAAIIAAVFGETAAEEIAHAFSVPEVGPLLGVMESLRGPIELFVGETPDWTAVEEAATRRLEESIAANGPFRTEIRSVSFLATR